LQAQSSFLNHHNIKTCHLNADRKISNDLKNAFVLINRNDIKKAEMLTINQREIILKKEHYIINFTVSITKRGCAEFDIWQIVQ
jgi:hypothetical protein